MPDGADRPPLARAVVPAHSVHTFPCLAHLPLCASYSFPHVHVVHGFPSSHLVHISPFLADLPICAYLPICNVSLSSHFVRILCTSLARVLACMPPRHPSARTHLHSRGAPKPRGPRLLRRPLHHGSPAPARLKLRSLMTRPAPACLAHLIPKLTRGACPGRSERRQRGL